MFVCVNGILVTFLAKSWKEEDDHPTVLLNNIYSVCVCVYVCVFRATSNLCLCLVEVSVICSDVAGCSVVHEMVYYVC